MSLPEFIKEDTWLGEIIGKNSYNLHAINFVRNSNIESLGLSAPFFLQTKVNCDDIETSLALQESGFLLIDTNVTYELKVTPAIIDELSLENEIYSFKTAQQDDRDHVKNCAKNSFIYTRYHLDPNVDNSLADMIKSEWAGNYFLGKRGEKMSLAIHSDTGLAVGFCQILEPQPDLKIIDLIAVDKQHRRQGLALGMIGHSVAVDDKVVVGTQVSNTPSIRCYEKMGFQQIKSQYVFHYHG